MSWSLGCGVSVFDLLIPERTTLTKHLQAGVDASLVPVLPTFALRATHLIFGHLTGEFGLVCQVELNGLGTTGCNAVQDECIKFLGRGTIVIVLAHRNCLDFLRDETNLQGECLDVGNKLSEFYRVHSCFAFTKLVCCVREFLLKQVDGIYFSIPLSFDSLL